MPRKATKPPEPIESRADTAAIQRDMDKALVDSSRLHFIETIYSENDGALFDLESSVARIRSTLDAAAELLLTGGCELILIKEHLPFGEFQEVVTERLGLSQRTAQNMMQAAAKFLAGTPRGKLATTLSRSKLLELLTEPDAALDELAEGGTLAGATLDKIECMTFRELRSTLRAERAKRAADTESNERLFEDKNKKIDHLADTLYKRDHATVDERLELLRVRLFEIQGRCILQLAEYEAVAKEIASIDHAGTPDALTDQLIDTANLIIDGFNEVRLNYGIPEGRPDLADFEAQMEAAGLGRKHKQPEPPPKNATAKISSSKTRQ